MPAMANLISRWWKYTTTKAKVRFEENADPKVQLEQAIAEAQEQHRRLRDQAANVIANQKQTEMRLNRALEELGRVNGNARQALRMAAEAERSGDTVKAAEYTEAAEAFAGKLIELESDVENMKSLHLEATEAANMAKLAVEQNAAALRAKLQERQKLLSQLDQAKLQEQVATAMSSLNEVVGQDVPTFEEVRQKIDARYARAKGMTELTSSTAGQSRMLEIEQAGRKAEARDRLALMRSELGLDRTTSSSPPELEPPHDQKR